MVLFYLRKDLLFFKVAVLQVFLTFLSVFWIHISFHADPDNETVDFLGFFTSWIRIQKAYLYADPCESGSKTLLVRIRTLEVF